MNRDRASRRLPVLLTLLIGLVLMIMPLPEGIGYFRPDWLVLIIIFWTIQLPRTWSIGTAWFVGIILDVAQGTLLGQHALAMCFVAFVTVRFHLQMRVFPTLQLTATVLAMLTLYQFLLLWINGVAGIDAPAISYWAPVISGTLLWPVVSAFLSGMRYRTRQGG